MVDELEEVAFLDARLLSQHGGYRACPGALDDRDLDIGAVLGVQQVCHRDSGVHVMVQPVDTRLKRARRGGSGGGLGAQRPRKTLLERRRGQSPPPVPLPNGALQLSPAAPRSM